MFSGYFDDDDTLRDLALPAASVFASSAPLIGDFYNENDDVRRGLTLGTCDFMSMPHAEPIGFQIDSCPVLNKHDARDEQAQFFFGDVPPTLPVDSNFCLEGTTVLIENLSPEQVGNGLLNMLRQDVAASITKVSRKKFSVKAYVHVDGLSCDVKVRVYRQEFGFSVEFQRRSGDSLAFQGLFRLALDHLNSYSRIAAVEQHAVAGEHLPKVMQVPSALGQAGSSKQELSIAPLLEMARCTSDIHLQSEVAEALADYASDANLSWQLSTPDALEVLENLSGIENVAVAHPLRRLAVVLGHVAGSNASVHSEGGNSCVFPAVGMLVPPPPPLMRL